MIIKPLIKSNIALNSHPIGCQKNIKNQLEDISDYSSLNTKPLNVLIIGGSSGYGLASRLVLANNNCFTYNVSYESAPSKRLSGSAGYYNNYYFNEFAQENNLDCYDINIDCFSLEAKHKVIKYFKDNNKKIDMIIYSVASGVRIDPHTGERYSSVLKPVNKVYTGYTVDIKKAKIKEASIQPATIDEIEMTKRVMGGDDYLLWIKMLDEANVFNHDIKSIAYTYIGSPLTYDIYKDGTIGKAKNDLKEKIDISNSILTKYNGNASLVAAKSIITKASCYIPTVPLYVGALNMIMKRENNYESITQHIYRMFADMIFANNSIVDEDGVIRLDTFELEESIQDEIKSIINTIKQETFFEQLDFQKFIDEFLNINGFGYDDVDYNKDIDLSIYKKTEV